MALFYRIFNNTLIPIQEVDRLGWTLDEEHFLAPDEYLEKGEFVIHRGCYSIGDWGIISAMPRILKQHYPNCKVFITSQTMIEKLYGPADKNPQNVWGMWSNPYKNVYHTFQANPYVDGYIDEYSGEVYHDHFRIRNKEYENDPLILQMLRFYRINLTIDGDYLPEVYFDEEEIERFSKFKKQHFGDEPYAAFSFRKFNDIQPKEKENTVREIVEKYKDFPFMYYSNTDINFGLNVKVDTKGMDVRLLLYLICNATVCTGMQTGIYDMCSRYTKVDVLSSASSMNQVSEHYLPSITYNFIK